MNFRRGNNSNPNDGKPDVVEEHMNQSKSTQPIHCANLIKI